jgi:hypothetical protein
MRHCVLTEYVLAFMGDALHKELFIQEPEAQQQFTCSQKWNEIIIVSPVSTFHDIIHIRVIWRRVHDQKARDIFGILYFGQYLQKQ